MKRSYCKLNCSAWPLLKQIRSIRSYQRAKGKEFMFCKYLYIRFALKRKATAQYSKWPSLTDLKSLDQRCQKIQILVAVLAPCSLENSCARGTEAAGLQISSRSILGSSVLPSQLCITGLSRRLPQKVQTGSCREKQCQCSALPTAGGWTPGRLSLDLAHSWTHRLNPRLVNHSA